MTFTEHYLAELDARSETQAVVAHSAFCGPDLLYVRSRLAHRPGDLDDAPEIGAELPANARRIAERR